MSLYLKEISEVQLKCLSSSVWLQKQTALRSIDATIQMLSTQYAPVLAQVLAAVVALLPGRLWDGKELGLTVLVSLVQKCKEVGVFLID